jgi:hypothetical protein
MLGYRETKLLSRKAFLRRQAWFAAFALGIVAFSLGVGMIGYHVFEGDEWVDAFVNAAMLLGGMGPVGELHTAAGKIFAGVYAIYCGMVLLVSVGVLFAPLLHRLLHRFHLEGTDTEEEGSERRSRRCAMRAFGGEPRPR